MVKLHPEFLERDGRRVFAVLPYEEFLAVQEMLNDAADLLDLRRAKADEGGAETVSLEEIRARFGLKD